VTEAPSWPRRLLAMSILAAAVGGCGYTTTTALLPSHIKKVAIPVFENTTSEYNLEREITDEVIARFVADNHVKIVDERSADAVIHGKVTSYKNSVFGFSAAERSQEYRVTIGLEVSFKDQVKNREMWADPEMVKTANYYVQPVPGDTARTEVDGRKQAIKKIADEILSRTVEGW